MGDRLTNLLFALRGYFGGHKDVVRIISSFPPSAIEGRREFGIMNELKVMCVRPSFKVFSTLQCFPVAPSAALAIEIPHDEVNICVAEVVRFDKVEVFTWRFVYRSDAVGRCAYCKNFNVICLG
uniref:Uncharacterized protein n=1 Tax=Cacopsylla melanoneura TaxID=428564 RepID=A0A8D8XHG4_9HEMI